jgi:hypothetical protein
MSHSTRAALTAVAATATVCFGLVWCARGAGAGADQRMDSGLLSRSFLEDTPGIFAQTNTVETEATGSQLGDDFRYSASRNSTSGDRWVRFQQEYGLEMESASAFGRMLQTAKYGLDTMCFAAQETARKLEFRYDVWEESPSSFGSGMAEPEYSLPMFGRFGHAQLKSEITVHDAQTGEAFIGLKLSIPFGPGGRESSEAPRGGIHRSESNG